MKTNILSRALLAVGIVAFSAMISAGACKVPAKGMNNGLVVKSTNAEKVKVKEDGGTSTVSIDYHEDAFAKTEASGVTDYAMTVAGSVTPLITSDDFKAAKSAFTVEIKDAKQGIVFAKTEVKDATIKSFMPGNIDDADGVTSIDAANAINGFVYVPDNTKGLSFATAFLGTKGFAPTVKATDVTIANSIGLVCVATATKVTEAVITAAKTADETSKTLDKTETLEGAQKATCSLTREIKEKIADWPTSAVAGSVTELKLTFIGVNTGKATVADIMKAAPGIYKVKDDAEGSKSGFTAERMEKLGKEYTATKPLQVVVKLVKPAADAS